MAPCRLQEHLGREFFHIEGSYLVKVVALAVLSHSKTNRNIEKYREISTSRHHLEPWKTDTTALA